MPIRFLREFIDRKTGRVAKHPSFQNPGMKTGTWCVEPTLELHSIQTRALLTLTHFCNCRFRNCMFGRGIFLPLVAIRIQLVGQPPPTVILVDQPLSHPNPHRLLFCYTPPALAKTNPTRTMPPEPLPFSSLSFLHF